MRFYAVVLYITDGFERRCIVSTLLEILPDRVVYRQADLPEVSTLLEILPLMCSVLVGF